MNAGNILPNPYKGKNAISAPASILFHTFKFSFGIVRVVRLTYPTKTKLPFGIHVRDPMPRQDWLFVLPINSPGLFPKRTMTLYGKGGIPKAAGGNGRSNERRVQAGTYYIVKWQRLYQ